MTDVNDDNDDGLTIILMCGLIFKIILFEENYNSTWDLQLILIDDKQLTILTNQKDKLRQNKDLAIIAELLEHGNQADVANIYTQHISRTLVYNQSLTVSINQATNMKLAVQPRMCLDDRNY
ncbi:unnamed protein product [Rotaria sp. Silwood2]|nr:unnamed protein product [Rotaria sp. Silwood2]CAF3340804.1 unnamed protein product [Rotaria sp. Silwood2]